MDASNREKLVEHSKKYNLPLPLTKEELCARNPANKNSQWIDVFCHIVHFDEKTGKRQLVHCRATDVEKILKDYEIPENEHVHLNHPDDIDCYRITDGKIHVCPIKTKKICVKRLRPKREEYFKTLDVQFMKNLEEGLDNSAVLNKKKRLRNMPNDSIWDTCKTLDDFKNITIDQILQPSTSNQ